MQSKKSFKASQLAILCYQMSLVFKSGIPLVEGMQLIGEEIEEKELRACLNEINEDLKGASRLYEAFEQRGVFPDYMVKMIEIGEFSGRLDECLEHLAKYYEKIDRLNKKLQNAITYPLILMGLMLLIIIALFVKILPMFKEILESVGGDMPLITSYVMNISDALKASGVGILIVLAVIAIGAVIYFRTERGARTWDRMKLSMPFIKKVYVKIYATRFSETMALLLSSGISYVESLRMTAPILGSTLLEERVLIYQQLVLKGQETDTSFKDIGIFPNLLIRMLKIGFKTGELEAMMVKLANIYEDEVERELNRMTTTIEPVLIIILSLIVGIILLTVMLPLISIMSSIGS